MSRTRKYIRAREVAEIHGVTIRTVRRWIATGVIPSEKIGGTRQIPVSAAGYQPDLSFMDETRDDVNDD